jgi:hypothetical protein
VTRESFWISDANDVLAAALLRDGDYVYQWIGA